MAPILSRAACGALAAAATVLLQGCEIGERPMTDYERRHGTLLVPNTIHISRQKKPTEALPIQHFQHKEKPPAPKPIVRTPAAPQPAPTPQPVPLQHTGPDCPALSFEIPSGGVQISQSMLGEFPKITCPRDFTYQGPRMQCSWVDRTCKVGSEGDTSVSSSLCEIEYNLTLPGAGLTSWPRGVAPKLVPQWGTEGPQGAAPPDDQARRRVLQTINLKNIERKTDALPAVVSKNLLLCKREAFADLDFEHAPIKRSYPPFTQEKPWFKTYSGIVSVNGEQVDLRVTRVGNIEAPGNPWLDGNSSAVGMINVNSTEQTNLRFQFVRSGTLQPVVVQRVFISLFNLNGELGSISNKKVTVGGMVAYYISENSSVLIDKTKDGRFEFLGDGVRDDRQPSDLSVEDMWLDNLKRTVVLDFRETAEFTIAVQALPYPNGQVLEFAGWSELVDQGREVSTVEDSGSILQRFSASSGDRPSRDQVVDVSVERSSTTAPFSSALSPLERLPAIALAAAGMLSLASIVGLVASAWRGRRRVWLSLEECCHQGSRRPSRREAQCRKPSEAILAVANVFCEEGTPA
mmetsp:Transcript_85756/g.170232  ORF Transcript_85756/g.170232 Transcript_85756/m.170232 type:complete len:575 (+) Transcript_85756:88-1812(+)